MSETPLPSRVPSVRSAPLMNRWMPSLRSVCNVPAGMINNQRVFHTDRPINRLSVMVSAGIEIAAVVVRPELPKPPDRREILGQTVVDRNPLRIGQRPGTQGERHRQCLVEDPPLADVRIPLASALA